MMRRIQHLIQQEVHSTNEVRRTNHIRVDKCLPLERKNRSILHGTWRGMEQSQQIWRCRSQSKSSKKAWRPAFFSLIEKHNGTWEYARRATRVSRGFFSVAFAWHLYRFWISNIWTMPFFGSLCVWDERWDGGLVQSLVLSHSSVRSRRRNRRPCMSC